MLQENQLLKRNADASQRDIHLEIRCLAGGQLLTSRPWQVSFAFRIMLSYTVYMSAILTVRTDDSLREALRRRAAAQGKTISALVREILEAALVERPFSARTGHLRGCLDLSPPKDDWGRRLREQNWRS